MSQAYIFNSVGGDEPLNLISIYIIIICGGRDSVVAIATRYELEGPGIESGWGRDFPHPSRPALGPTQPLTQWVPGLFSRV